MIDHIWSIVCARAIVDRETGSVSLHEVIEQINIKGEPESDKVLPVVFDLITYWIRSNSDEPENGEMRLSFSSPSGEVKLGYSSVIDLTKHERSRNILRIENLPIQEPGRHYFNIEQKIDDDNWRQVAAIPISVKFVPLDEG